MIDTENVFYLRTGLLKRVKLEDIAKVTGFSVPTVSRVLTHGEAFGGSYELPPDQYYCETCAAIGSLMWNWRLLLTTGDGRYADLIERMRAEHAAGTDSAEPARRCNPGLPRHPAQSTDLLP